MQTDEAMVGGSHIEERFNDPRFPVLEGPFINKLKPLDPLMSQRSLILVHQPPLLP